MSEIHPALAAAQNSWRCVQTHDKQGWLDLMADDVCIEDPIGEAPTNPTGKGVRGKEEVSAFYDSFIGPATLVIETHESSAAGNESAHVLSLNTTLPNGVTTRVRGIFTYHLNDAGKLTNLRGYWTLADMTFEQPAE
ncbi:MAG: nuclear transport factor 2 family protein [Myxococcota bacterium]|jgi:steroid delta-isomerase